MAGGLIQLVAIGIEDMFLTEDPQITFFKIVYRRHTNFSTEPIPQRFSQPPDFGKKVSCVLSRSGDLIGATYLVLVLPKVPKFLNTDGTDDLITKFAWVRKIGFAIVKTIDVEIGGQLIDRQYGEWLNVWTELVGLKDRGIRIMIGNVPELTDFSSEKTEYTLYIPLNFWFCKTSGSALPIISLQYSEVKIILELFPSQKCYLINPTHSIQLQNDIVLFEQFEYIEQTVNGFLAAGVFNHFDNIEKKMYYMLITNNNFQSITNTATLSQTEILNITSDPSNDQFLIHGLKSKFAAMPAINATPKTFPAPVLNLVVKDCFLLVEYIYLDDEERVKFAQAKNEYLIERIYQFTPQTIESINRMVRVNFIHPCRFMVWFVQLAYLQASQDYFNYTDSYIYVDDIQIGKSLVTSETIILNGKERLSFREASYFNWVQDYQHFLYSAPEGFNIYSFALFPIDPQSSGTCNMSKIDNIQIQLSMSRTVSPLNQTQFVGYGLTYNMLRISNGLGGVLFAT